ncbi:glycosyltransferase family 4 protein, partial [Chryseobacterium artocarpi]|uniref:glycosyltransferase family 4 protein n=1 Tax=Chryseobacterium artocarpi TaxID=1414727 RepID=UPI003F2CCA91
IEAELIIIGKGMDDYFKDLKNKKVKVYGYVEDLSSYYYNANVVIAPIFTGGGMKTKIAEAMMYGKNILGTEEAFEGYELIKETHFLFNTAEDCHEIITVLKNNEEISKYNKLSRKCFLDNYSNAIIKQKFTDLFVEINNK